MCPELGRTGLKKGMGGLSLSLFQTLRGASPSEDLFPSPALASQFPLDLTLPYICSTLTPGVSVTNLRPQHAVCVGGSVWVCSHSQNFDEVVHKSLAALGGQAWVGPRDLLQPMSN